MRLFFGNSTMQVLYILKSGVKMTIFSQVVGGSDETNTRLRSESNVMT